MSDHTTVPFTGAGDATAQVATIPADGIGGNSANIHQQVVAEFLVANVPTPITAANPLPVTQSGVATSAKQDTAQTSLTSIDGKTPALGQALAAASVPVVLTAAQVSTLTPPAAITGFALETGGNLATLATETGATNETAPASDTATSGLNGRLQRIAQRLTSLIALIPASLGQKAKASAFAVTLASDEDALALAGSVTETAPGTDTASSGMNGRLQRIAQRLTSLIALLPTSLGANGGLKIEGVASGTAIPVTSTDAPASSANNTGSTVSIPASPSTLALASFATRKGGTIYSPTTNANIIYVSLGGTASSSTIPLNPGD